MGKLKEEKIFIEKNKFLNEKIKEYVKEKNEEQFLKDFCNIGKIKDKIIDLSKPNPQKILIKAYWIKVGIPFKIPAELKLKKTEI